MNNASERILWEIVHGAGWWWWGVVAALAAANLYAMYRLAAPVTRYGRYIRIVAYVGFLLIACSPFNTGFGPLGVPLVLLAYLGVHHQMYRACVAAGKIAPPEGTLFRRIVHAMIETDARRT